jgi:hypothetical protein
MQPHSKPALLASQELLEILAAEDAGPLTKVQKLRKKVLQDAYDHALKKKKVCVVVPPCSVRACNSRGARTVPSWGVGVVWWLRAC